MADDSSQGGLGLLGIDPSLLLNLGIGLMSGASYGSNAGKGLMEGIGNYYNQKMAKQDIALKQQQYGMNNLNMQKTMQLLDIAGRMMGGDDSQQQSAQPQGQPPPSLMPGSPVPQGANGVQSFPLASPQASAAPQGQPPMPAGGAAAPVAAPQGQAPQQPPQGNAPSWLTPPTDQQIYSAPVGGMRPGLVRAYNLLQNKDPLDTTKSTRSLQQEQARDQFAPQMAQLQGVVTSDDPVRDIKSNPQLQATWDHYATARGMDPVKDLVPTTARQVFADVGNAYRASLGQAETAPPQIYDTKQIGLGGTVQTDRITGKQSTGAPQQETAQFISPDGTSVKMLTKAQGVAQGLAPFNPTIFGANNVSDQAIQMAADTYRTTGKFPTNMARNFLLQGKVLDRVAADAANSGDTAGSIAARAASLKANGQALDQVTKLETVTNGYAATLDKNLTNLQQSYKQVDTTGSPLLNRAVRIWQQGGTGDKQTADMVVWLNAVQGEYAKLKSGNLGNAPASDASMRDAKEVINKYMNDGGIEAVANAMRGEAANRRAAIAEQKSALGGALGGNAPGVNPPNQPGHPTQPGQSTTINGFTVTRIN